MSLFEKMLFETLGTPSIMGFDTSKTWYHGTPHDITAFKRNRSDIGIHFGTLEQAHARIEDKIDAGASDGYNIIPVHLKLKNPARIDDVGWFDAENVSSSLVAKGHITKDEARRHTTLTELRGLLERKGFDGLIYKNNSEIKGVAELMRKENEYRKAAFDDMKVPLKLRGTVTKEQQEHPLMKLSNDYYKKRKELHDNPIYHHDSVIVFHPNQIRSIHASYNYKKNKSGNILESV